MKVLKTKITILFLMVSAMAFSQDYDDFDTNSDEMIDQNEFSQNYDSNFSALDVDGNGVIDDQEFNEMTFNNIDENQNGYLSENDWNNGHENLYGDYYGSTDYDQFDGDGDGRISSEEFNNQMYNSDYYSSYDSNMDGNIDSNEFTEGVFNTWDENWDGGIAEIEYDAYSDYYN